MAQSTTVSAAVAAPAVAASKGKNKGMVSQGKGKPGKPANTAFTALVASQQKQGTVAASKTAAVAAAVTMPHTATAAHVQAHTGFVRPIQNGRKGYAPNTVGALIWQTADALQAATPGTPVTSAAVRLALPQVAPASVSAGLSHWRKFNGTMRVKGQAPVALVAPAAPAPVAADAKTGE